MFSVITRIALLSLMCTGLSNSEKKSCAADKDLPWSYDDDLPNGPQNWGKNYPDCDGKKQSPIDIEDNLNDEYVKPLKFFNYDIPIKRARMLNNGHTVKVIPDDGEERLVYINGTSYILKQLHFHWGDRASQGSEHQLGGSPWSMELHLVHVNCKGELAVIGEFFNEVRSKFMNKGLSPIIESLENILYKKDETRLSHDINLLDILDLDKEESKFFRYDGSLTTPPCTEGVIWSVITRKRPIGIQQISVFRKLYSIEKGSQGNTRDCKISNNFRPIQPLNGRKIYTTPDTD